MTTTNRAGASLSVVIPFYRDEVHIAEAVASAAGQPVDDLEILVVNDRPDAESDGFLAGLAARLPIRVLRHAENLGLASARNTGIEAATKSHVAFLDADDVFVAGGLARNLAFAAETGADLTHAPTLSMFVGRLHPQPLRRDHLLFGRRIPAATLGSAPQAQYIVSSWSSIYRRDFLHGKAIRFDAAQRRFEDRLFVLDAVFAAERIAFSEIPARIWRRRLGSITTAERALADIAMQMDLLTKCVGAARRFAAAGPGRDMALQRELHHSISRVIWDVRILEHAPAETPQLDAARARFTAALAGLDLGRAVFADLPTMKISHLWKETDGHAPVTWRGLLEAFRLARAGEWAGLVAWRRALRLPAPPRIAPPRLDKELILHIGLHKTGTTFLQRMLEQDRARLAAEGVLFPEAGFVRAVADNRREGATPGHVGFSAALRHGAKPVFERLRAEAEASRADRVLLSAENFSWPFDPPEERARFLRRAAEAFEGFPRRRILVVFRRPDDYVDRYWREHVFLGSEWARRTAEQFAAELGPHLTDLGFLAGDWAEFAGGAATPIGYDAAGRDLHRVFYAALGLAPPEAAEAAAYPTPSAEQALAARVIAMARIEKGPKAEAFALFLAATAGLPAAPGGSTLSRATRRRLIDAFAARSLPWLRARGVDAPADAWRDSLDAAPEGPPPLDPALADAAVAALAAVWDEPFATAANPLWLRAYRLGRGAVARFW